MARTHFNLLLLPALNLFLFFFAIRFFVQPDLTPYYWLALASLVLTSFYAGARNLHSVQYYVTFLIYVSFFGYLIQSAIGVSYLVTRGGAGSFGYGEFLLFTVNAAGIILGSELFISTGRSRFERLDATSPPSRVPSVRALPSLALLLGLSAVVSIAAFGFDGFFAPRFEQFLEVMQQENEAKASSYALFAFRILKYLPYVCVVALYAGFRKTTSNATAFLALLLVVAAYALFASNPVNTARYVSLVAFSMAFFAWISMRERTVWIPTLLSFAPTFLVLGLPITSIMRHGVEAVTSSKFFETFSSLEYSTLQMTITGGDVSTKADGLYVLSGLLVFVPRAIFPDKAGSLGEAIAEHGGFSYLNSAVPSFFAAYVDGGMVALFFFSFISGYVLAWGQIADGFDWFRRRDFYRLAVFSLVPIFARGDFSTFTISAYALAAAYEVTRFAARLRWGTQTAPRTHVPASR